MAQPGPSDYRARQPYAGHPQEHSDGIMDQVAETGRDIGERAGDLAQQIGDAIKERPYTTVAIAAGLAFAVGALWKLGHQRSQSRLEALLAQMPELPGRDSLIPRRWR
jgi:hypothetical protein